MSIWTVAAALALTAGQPALTDEQVSPDHAPARLEALLAERDYVALGRTIRDVSRQADLNSDLDWLRAKMVEGNSAFVSMLYSRLLWVAAAGLPETQRHQLRQTAVMATLYAQAAITIDGARCGDRSAPQHRSEQLLSWNPEIWPFIAALSAEERQHIVDIAVMGERRTADRRDAIGDVDFLCRAGLEETQYNLTHGSAREVPSAPGVIGRTIELRGDGGYVPSQAPESEWRARAATLRAQLPADLTAYLASAASSRE